MLALAGSKLSYLDFISVFIRGDTNSCNNCYSLFLVFVVAQREIYLVIGPIRFRSFLFSANYVSGKRTVYRSVVAQSVILPKRSALFFL